jgi:4a-hydroxytetrahydrobiopterin dehydratase
LKALAELLADHCRALAAGAMTDAEVREQLGVLPDWHFDGSAISRTFRFGDYCETIAFVNALAYLVHDEDHHPDLRVSYDHCEVRFNTHSVNGISSNDFICAAKADAVHARRFVSRPA